MSFLTVRTVFVALMATPAIAMSAAPAVSQFGQLPLSFEPNRGQTDPRAAYLARGSGYTLFLAPTSAVIELQRRAYDEARRPPVAGGPRGPFETAVIRMDLVGANI